MPRQPKKQRRVSTPSSSSDEQIFVNSGETENQADQITEQVAQLSISTVNSNRRVRDGAIIPKPVELSSNRVVKIQPSLSKQQSKQDEESKDKDNPQSLKKADQNSIKMRRNVQINRKSLAKMTPEAQLQTCAICLDEIPILQQASLDKCVHVYCHQCILKWTQDCSSECPQCKKEISFIIYKNVTGEEVRQPVENRIFGEIDIKCAVCDQRVREADIFRHVMPPSSNEAEICISCHNFVVHVRCMNETEQIDRAINEYWECQECANTSSSDEDEILQQMIVRLAFPGGERVFRQLTPQMQRNFYMTFFNPVFGIHHRSQSQDNRPLPSRQVNQLHFLSRVQPSSNQNIPAQNPILRSSAPMSQRQFSVSNNAIHPQRAPAQQNQVLVRQGAFRVIQPSDIPVPLAQALSLDSRQRQNPTIIQNNVTFTNQNNRRPNLQQVQNDDVSDSSDSPLVSTNNNNRGGRGRARGNRRTVNQADQDQLQFPQAMNPRGRGGRGRGRGR